MIEERDETQLGRVIDYDVTGMIVGFDIMNASKKMDQPAMIQLEVA